LIDIDRTRSPKLNSEAEGFLNASAQIRARCVPVWDMIARRAPLEEAFTAPEENGTPLFCEFDVDVGSGQRPPVAHVR